MEKLKLPVLLVISLILILAGIIIISSNSGLSEYTYPGKHLLNDKVLSS